MSLAPQSRADQPAGATLVLDFEWLPHVADKNAVEPAIEPAEAGATGGIPKGCVEDVAVQPEPIGNIQNAAVRAAGPPE